MKFFEATNGFSGFGYVRCYVWAKDEQEAWDLAQESFKKEAASKGYHNRYWRNIDLEVLLDTEVNIEGFATEPTDE